MTLGITNHSHIGANHLPKPVGNQLHANWAAMRSGMKSDVFLIQNQTKSIGKKYQPSRCQSMYESQPASTQYPRTVRPPLQKLLFTGGHIHASTGTASTTAGMKKASHSRRRLTSAQNGASATTVPNACTGNAGMTPATTPANRNVLQSCRSGTASHTSRRTISARL